MVAVDTLCDEEVYNELRAKTFVSYIQKLRKSNGLVLTDRVEIFYDEDGEVGNGLIDQALGYYRMPSLLLYVECRH